MPKVSIVIPCYNGEKTIACCVESLLRQSFTDLEVIIVNDGSTDKTERICESIKKKDNRVKLITKKNEGRMLARYTGYKEASGEYVAFTDADDYHPRESIQCLYELAENNQVDCVVGNYADVFGSLPFLKRKYNLPFAGEMIRGYEKWECWFGYANNNGMNDNLLGVMWGRLFRKSAIDKAVAVHTDMVFPKALMEDWWFTLITMEYIDSFIFTDEIVYYYRRGGSSSGDFQFLEKSNGYFDYRFSYFNNFITSRDELLVRTFICFVESVITETWLKVNAQKYNELEITSFINDQLSRNNNIVEWMSTHSGIIPTSYKERAKLALEKDAKGILSIAQKKYEKLKSRRRITGTLFCIYDKICRFLEFIGCVS